MDTKETLIHSIRQHNPTASDAFLVHFDESALRNYLMHLSSLARPRNRDAAVIRPRNHLAICTREKVGAV